MGGDMNKRLRVRAADDVQNLDAPRFRKRFKCSSAPKVEEVGTPAVSIPSTSQNQESAFDFGGEGVNFIQIGLGNNTTLIQNLAGSDKDWSHHMAWLLRACSNTSAETIRGVAVEPVAHHAEVFQKMARSKLKQVVVVQAAIAETDDVVDVQVLDSPEKLLAKVSKQLRQDLEWDLGFLENMSCVGGEHPEVPYRLDRIRRKYGKSVRPKMVPRRVEQLSYSSLCQRLNFCGCQVLVVDAEGHDASILRSMLAHCQQNSKALPELIQFETRGHCDSCEGGNAEWNIIESLQKAGYTLLAFSHHDTYLVLAEALKREERLQRWVGEWVCSECKKDSTFPYFWHRNGIYCEKCCEGW
eukprot:TRINITY_DN23173_c1_g1_i1.p1 TRINITY_DN23173_c1_g1~~TRINITY_DN23173_c1_g1_i1.p1  ORF type:complete len:355 (-),score=38.35 TRINITY_DN23173_c1_g1_i1:120-1184(-)